MLFNLNLKKVLSWFILSESIFKVSSIISSCLLTRFGKSMTLFLNF